MRFKEKKIVITGGSSGIGAAVVQRFLTEGAKVHNIDLQPPQYDTDNDNFFFHECDVSRFPELNACFEDIVKTHLKIDYLFANAGIYHLGTVEETTPEDFDRILAVNLKGVFYAIKSVLPSMVRWGKGSIVINGSDQSLVGKERSFAYGASKGALGQLTKSVAVDYSPRGIRINCICPGTINTPLYKRGIVEIAERYHGGNQLVLTKAIKDAQLLRRIGEAEEVANLVAFLLSDQASFITGALLPVDGGYVAK